MKLKESLNIYNEDVFRTIEVTANVLYGYLENTSLPFKMNYDKDGYLQVSVITKHYTKEDRDIFKKILTKAEPWRYININYIKQ